MCLREAPCYPDILVQRGLLPDRASLPQPWAHCGQQVSCPAPRFCHGRPLSNTLANTLRILLRTCSMKHTRKGKGAAGRNMQPVRTTVCLFPCAPKETDLTGRWNSSLALSAHSQAKHNFTHEDNSRLQGSDCCRKLGCLLSPPGPSVLSQVPLRLNATCPP